MVLVKKCFVMDLVQSFWCLCLILLSSQLLLSAMFLQPLFTVFQRFLANSVAFTEDMKSPRVIKSHMPLEFLPPDLLDKAKGASLKVLFCRFALTNTFFSVIYVCRNPRDVCVSYFHHTNTLHTSYLYEGNFEQYMNLFIKGKLSYGSYWYHLKVTPLHIDISLFTSHPGFHSQMQSGLAKKDHPNMMFLWFEDMKKDLIKVIRDVCKFTGYHLTDYKVLVLDDALYIDNFR